MQRYSLYIIKHLAAAAVVIVVSLTGIAWLTQGLRFVDFIVNRGVSFLTFLQLTGLMLPSLLMLLLPIALVIAVVFVYHRLTMDSELVVLRGAGLSRWQLARPALTIAVAAAIAGYVISAYLLPVSYRKFRDMQFFLRDNYASLLLQEEVFNTPMEGLTVYLRSRDRDGTLKGILVHDNRVPGKEVTMMAEEGRLARSDSGPRFELSRGNRQEVREGKFSLLNFDNYTLDLNFYARQEEDRIRDPEELTIPELFRAPQGLSAQDATKRLAAAHHRLTWPLYAVSLTTVALAILLSGEFNRRGQWRRIAAAILAAAALVLLAVMTTGIVGRHLVLFPLLYLWAAGSLVAGFLALYDDGGRRTPLPRGARP